MKTDKKTSTSKLAKRFDNELKTLIMEDLRSFRSRHQFLSHNNNQGIVQQTLSAA